MDKPSFARLLQCLAVHMREHENRSVVRILNDGADEASGIKPRGEAKTFVEIRLAHEGCPGNCNYASFFPYHRK